MNCRVKSQALFYHFTILQSRNNFHSFLKEERINKSINVVYIAEEYPILRCKDGPKFQMTVSSYKFITLSKFHLTTLYNFVNDTDSIAQ